MSIGRRGFLGAMVTTCLVSLTGCEKTKPNIFSDREVNLPPYDFSETSPISEYMGAAVRLSSFPDLQSAVNTVAGGGTVYIDVTTRIDNPVTIPPGVRLVGSTALPASNGNHGNLNLNQLSQVHILVGRGVETALFVDGGAGLHGVFLHKEGVVFGQLNADNFHGLAVRLSGEDCWVERCFITGFNQAVYSNFVQRSRVIDNRIDCTSGVWLERVYDIARVNGNHCWAFVTVGSGEVNHPNHIFRSGTAFKFSDGGDWNHLYGNFCIGYQIGYHLHNVEHCTLVQCGADNLIKNKTSTGFLLTGKAKNTALIACQAAGHLVGFDNQSGEKNLPDQMIGCSYWANVTNVRGF